MRIWTCARYVIACGRCWRPIPKGAPLLKISRRTFNGSTWTLHRCGDCAADVAPDLPVPALLAADTPAAGTPEDRAARIDALAKEAYARFTGQAPLAFDREPGEEG